MNFNVSYTLWKSYKKCHHQAFLQYVQKVMPWDKIDQRNFLVGTVADFLFEKWVNERNFEPGWMLKKAPGLFEWFAGKKYIKYLGPTDKDGLIFKTCRAVEILEEKILELGMDKKKFETQKKIAFNSDGVPFFMKLDIWYPEERRLVDLKVTKDKKYLDDDQLRMYSWGLAKEGLIVESAGFYSPLMKEFEVEADVSMTSIEKFEQEIWKDIKLMQEGNWDCTAEDCWGCSVKPFCTFDPLNEVKNLTKTEGSGFKFEL